MDEIYELHKGKMEKTLRALDNEYASVKAGRANPTILDRIKVDYYGAPTPINQIATVAVPEPQILTIQPWDASAVKMIEKAIQASDIGINPQSDGRVIRLIFPPLTEERRREIVKSIHKYAEEAKIAIRSARRDAIDKYKAQKKESLITEDDLKANEKAMQDLTDKYCKEIEALANTKEKEIMKL